MVLFIWTSFGRSWLGSGYGFGKSKDRFKCRSRGGGEYGFVEYREVCSGLRIREIYVASL